MSALPTTLPILIENLKCGTLVSHPLAKILKTLIDNGSINKDLLNYQLQNKDVFIYLMYAASNSAAVMEKKNKMFMSIDKLVEYLETCETPGEEDQRWHAELELKKLERELQCLQQPKSRDEWVEQIEVILDIAYFLYNFRI